ncbi:hypothetical protein QFZ98_005006 [Paraburkholderia youngii]
MRVANTEESAKTEEQKVTRAKVGTLGLAHQLGNVSQACRVMGHFRSRLPLPNSTSNYAARGQIRIANEVLKRHVLSASP